MKSSIKILLSFIAIIYAVHLAAIFLYIFNEDCCSFTVQASDVPTSVEFPGAYDMADPITHINVPYEVNLGTTDWTFTTITKLDQVKHVLYPSWANSAISAENSFIKDSGAILGLRGGSNIDLMIPLAGYAGYNFQNEYFGSYFDSTINSTPDEHDELIGHPDIDNAGQNDFGIDIANANHHIAPTGILNEDTWYWMAITYDESEETLKQYLNGNLVGTHEIDIDESESGELVLGRFGSDSFGIHALDGRIAQFRAYSGTVTDEEIQDWYESDALPSATLEVEYLFKNESNGSVTDTSGNNRNTTVSNFSGYNSDHPLVSESGSESIFGSIHLAGYRTYSNHTGSYWTGTYSPNTSGTTITVPYTVDIANSDWTAMITVKPDLLYRILDVKDAPNTSGRSVASIVPLSFSGDIEANIFEALWYDWELPALQPFKWGALFDGSRIHSDEIVTTQWQRLAATYDSDTKTLSYYVDGELLDELVLDTDGTELSDSYNPFNIAENASGQFVIGGDLANQKDYFGGQIDEFRVYSRTLVSSEIQNWANNQQVDVDILDSTDLEVLYLFEEETGTSVNDLSGNGRDGTISNYAGRSTVQIASIRRRSDRESGKRIFIPPPPIKITLNELNVEYVNPGDVVNLSWEYNRGLKYVNLYYSLNNDGEWQQIAKLADADLISYPWRVPKDLTYDNISFKVGGSDLAIDFVEDNSESYKTSEVIAEEETELDSEESQELEYTYPPGFSEENVIGASPVTGEAQEVDLVKPGSLIKGESFDSVYLISDSLTRRPIFNQAIFNSYSFLREEIDVVTDATLAALPLGKPVLPRPGSSLLRFDAVLGIFISETDVYYDKDVLREVRSNDTIKELIGPNSENATIQLPISFFNLYMLGDSMTDEELEKALKLIIN